MSKIIIDKEALSKIQDFARTAFKELKDPDKLGSHGSAQHYCIIQGLWLYLKSKGKKPEFEIKPEDNTEYTTLED